MRSEEVPLLIICFWVLFLARLEIVAKFKSKMSQKLKHKRRI